MNNLRTASLVLVLGLAGNELVGQDPSMPSRGKATPDDYKKLATAARFDGRVAGIGPKSITVYVDDTRYQLAYRQAMAYPEPLRSKYLAELKKAGGPKEYEFELAPKFALRKTTLKFDYDDRGKPKTYTSAELAKLKGEGNKPGYIARPDEIEVASPVTVHLTRGKNNRPVATMAVVNNAAKKVLP